jgi:hypothetical protein
MVDRLEKPEREAGARRQVFCARAGKLHPQPAPNFPGDAFVGTGDLDANP